MTIRLPPLKRGRLGYTEAQVQAILSRRKLDWGVFILWMESQTYAEDPRTGEPLYYRTDVRRFIARSRGARVVWD